jgi:predicted dehydrogenase
MIQVAVIGFGYWGPNVVRNFCAQEGFRVVAICDQNTQALKRAKSICPEALLTTDAADVLTSPKIDAVAVVTPVWTHYPLAKVALENDKHVFVEKPFTACSAEAAKLIEIAERKGLIIMVDHTFLFTGAVKKIRELIDGQVLGDLYYYDSLRVNLGLFQHDVNVIWDLAPHDLSIMDYLIDSSPEEIVATGEVHVNGHEDVAFITVYFPQKVIAHINVNWLSPVKVRTTLIGGEKKMVVWNDLDADEKIKVYDKGVQISGAEDVRKLLVSYRSGDMWAPRVDQNEALDAELRYFHECISRGKRPFNGGIAGWRVVRMLEAAQTSVKMRGKAVKLGAENMLMKEQAAA